MLYPCDTEYEQIGQAVFGPTSAKHFKNGPSSAYFNHYCALVSPTQPGDVIINIGALSLENHAALIRCIELLRRNPLLSFDDFVSQIPNSKNLDINVKEEIARLTVNVAFMISFSSASHDPIGVENSDLHWAKWEKQVRFASFIEEAFRKPTSDAQDQQDKTASLIRHKKSLKAWKLRTRHGIKIRGTNNLLEHLLYNPNTKVLKVFHQVFFLRAQLKMTKDLPLDLSFEESLKLGALPPKLLLETLLTFHDILFPILSPNDRKSERLLLKMINEHGFDEEAEDVTYVRDVPRGIILDYWGERLAKLHDAVKRPAPTNSVVSWFERHTSERNALTVAILGLFLAALFGLLSFIVGLLQLILAWIAWKYPNN